MRNQLSAVCLWQDLPVVDRLQQSVAVQRPFGCETKFTSRTKHHVTFNYLKELGCKGNNFFSYHPILSKNSITLTNSEPCPYWKLLPKPTVLTARMSVCLFSVLPTPLGHKEVTTKLPNGIQYILHSMLALMVSTIYLTSSSLTYGPAGKHIPTLKMASLTPLTYAGASLYTGCLCIGFQTGRASIPA